MWGHNPLYYVILGYIFWLCSFIPIWVLLLLTLQAFNSGGACIVPGESESVELLWTIIPTILVGVLSLLNVGFTVTFPWNSMPRFIKITGSQWYWNYELALERESFDSYMSDFVNGVDRPLRIVMGENYSFFVSSSDVIHSFSVPSLQIKMDGIPGRLNELGVLVNRLGVFVGYCSELCGAGHAYMPIVVEVVKETSPKLKY